MLALGPVDSNGTPLAVFVVHGGRDPGTAATDCEFVCGGRVASANLELRQEDTGTAFGDLLFLAVLFVEG